MASDFPTKGEDKKVSLSNSNFPRFDRAFAERLKEDDPEIWKAGGNIRGNDAFSLWGRALDGDDGAAVLSWIKEREAWAARHLKDGSQFPGESPTLSNVAGVVAAIKWGVELAIGSETMKSTIQELRKKLNERTHNTTTTETRHLLGIQETEEGYVLTFAKNVPLSGPPTSEEIDNGPAPETSPLTGGGGSGTPESGTPTTQQPTKDPVKEPTKSGEESPEEIRNPQTRDKMKEQVERRYLAPETQTIEIRSEGGERRVEGYAAIFNSPTTIHSRTGAFREQIARGAFEGRLNDPVVALFNHDNLRPLAKVGAGLELSVDDYGLRYSFPIPDTTTGRDLVELMERGIVKEASFAFTIAPGGESWTRSDDDVESRTITKLGRLIDVSVVTLGAYSDATAALRSFEGANLNDLPSEGGEAPTQEENSANGPKKAEGDHIQSIREQIRRLRIHSILKR